MPFSPAPDQVQIPVQYPVPTRLLSPEELRTSFWQIVQNRLLHHANFHSANCFTRAASKLPLDRLVEFIYSMQASNLPVQLASYAGFSEGSQFANSTFSEARSRLSSLFFKSVFYETNDLLEGTGFRSTQRYPYPCIAIDGSTLLLEPFHKDSDDFMRTKSPSRKRAGSL